MHRSYEVSRTSERDAIAPAGHAGSNEGAGAGEGTEVRPKRSKHAITNDGTEAPRASVATSLPIDVWVEILYDVGLIELLRFWVLDHVRTVNEHLRELESKVTLANDSAKDVARQECKAFIAARKKGFKDGRALANWAAPYEKQRKKGRGLGYNPYDTDFITCMASFDELFGQADPTQDFVWTQEMTDAVVKLNPGFFDPCKLVAQNLLKRFEDLRQQPPADLAKLSLFPTPYVFLRLPQSLFADERSPTIPFYRDILRFRFDVLERFDLADGPTEDVLAALDAIGPAFACLKHDDEHDLQLFSVVDHREDQHILYLLYKLQPGSDSLAQPLSPGESS
ncbi:hypothetical protein JCM10212_006393 [Sporobolomyces blumeae]